MTDERLDALLEEAVDGEYTASAKIVYAAREKIRQKEIYKEQRQEYLPFIIVIVINSILALTVGGLCIWLFASTIKEVMICISLALVMLNLPAGAYMLARLYYKEKENGGENVWNS